MILIHVILNILFFSSLDEALGHVVSVGCGTTSYMASDSTDHSVLILLILQIEVAPASTSLCQVEQGIVVTTAIHMWQIKLP